eukprot:1498950-Rhodomonas_salina.1
MGQESNRVPLDAAVGLRDGRETSHAPCTVGLESCCGSRQLCRGSEGAGGHSRDAVHCSAWMGGRCPSHASSCLGRLLQCNLSGLLDGRVGISEDGAGNGCEGMVREGGSESLAGGG